MSELRPSAPVAGPAGPGPTDAGPAATEAGRPPGRPPMVATASITTFGHLAWIGWVWLGFGVVVLGIVGGYGLVTDGMMQDSLWQGFAAGWQRWVILGAGFATTRTFAPMLIANGVTRAQMSSSVLVAMVTLAVLGGLYISMGFLVEGVLFDAHGWTHALDGGGRTMGAATIAELGLRYTLVLAVSFAAGWLMGIGFHRFGTETGLALVVPCAAPMLLVELLLLDGRDGLGIAAMEHWSGPPLAVGALASLAVIALTAVVGSRSNRELPLQA